MRPVKPEPTYEMAYIKIQNMKDDIAKTDELLHFHDRHSVVPSPKRMNLLERAYKSMGKLAFLALTFFALMAAKARFWP